MKKRKGYAKEMRKLQDDLKYWKMQVRLEQRWLKSSKTKVKETEQKIEELENEQPTGD